MALLENEIEAKFPSEENFLKGNVSFQGLGMPIEKNVPTLCSYK